MPLVGFSLKGYRCFAQRQDIELRPITVVLGRNNSGKSALVRAPVVLAAGIKTQASSPLDLDVIPKEIVGSFTDLIYGGFSQDRGITVAVSVDSQHGPARLEATVRHFREGHRQLADEVELWTSGTRQVRLDLNLELDDQMGVAPEYIVDWGDEVLTGIPVDFEGLTPVAFNSDIAGAPDAAAIQAGFPTVRYLGPFRARPRRWYELPGRPKADVGTAGEHAAGIIINDVARRGGWLLKRLNEDIEQHLPGWKVGTEQHGEVWSLVLIGRSDERISVNLTDTGTGVAQALPIFVQRALDAINPSRPDVLEVVEQPELHLHPGAHAALADLYLNAVERTRTRFLIETHSETFLLRLRRRIAEGLDPATLAVYFVEQVGNASTVRPIHADANGDVDYWPEGVFTEDYDETRALAAAQVEREERGAR